MPTNPTPTDPSQLIRSVIYVVLVASVIPLASVIYIPVWDFYAWRGFDKYAADMLAMLTVVYTMAAAVFAVVYNANKWGERR